MEKIGIIDLGSNTARLVIVNLFEDGHFMVVDELKESVRLGQDMERDGFLKPQRVAETIKTLKMFKRLCDASGVERIIAVATAAVRRAKNQRSFLDEIQATCNLKIKVLSEEEEATLVYRHNLHPAVHLLLLREGSICKTSLLAILPFSPCRLATSIHLR